jgi:hypothetical protein
MPAQSDLGRRSAVELMAPRTTTAHGHDHYYMRRMKEILHIPIPSPGTSHRTASTAVSPGTLRYSHRTGENSIPLVGALIHVGPPAHPVRLLDHVYMGSQRNADDVELLKRLGITHVLNCAGLRRYDFSRSPYPKDAGIKGFLMISAEVGRNFPLLVDGLTVNELVNKRYKL